MSPGDFGEQNPLKLAHFECCKMILQLALEASIGMAVMAIPISTCAIRSRNCATRRGDLHHSLSRYGPGCSGRIGRPERYKQQFRDLL